MTVVLASYHPWSVQAKGSCLHLARWCSTARIDLWVLWLQPTHLKTVAPFRRVLSKKHAHTDSSGFTSRSAHSGTPVPLARGSISCALNQTEARIYARMTARAASW